MKTNKIVWVVFSCGLMFGSNVFGQIAPAATEEHKVLANDVGTWDCEMKMWMAGPDSEPMTMKGSEVNEMFGDFWVVSKFKADFNGQPFEGRAATGYDPVKKKYVGTWFDTMNPFLSHMEGTYDKATKTLTMMVTGTGPDGKPTKGKNVSVIKDDGTRMFTMYMTMPDAPDEFVKSMEIMYKKR